METILDIQSLSKSYDGKKFALSDVNFSIKTGRICAIVGESGSGKSTLIRLIAGLERPNSGKISINGKTVSDDTKICSPDKREVGLVFQDFALFPHLTVVENLSFGLKKKDESIVKSLLALIKMQEYANVYPATLSGGQEQRVAIARTLALKPELLLLDEPFSNLDSNLKTALRQEIRLLIKKVGTSMVFITHDLIDAIDIADEIILLKGGKIIQHSTMTDFVAHIQDEDVKKILSDLTTNAERVLQMMKNL